MMGARPEEGFSLIETLVALAIIASMTALLFDAISLNARMTERVARKREAILLARSLLAQASIPDGQGAMAEKGQWRTLYWRLSHRTIDGGARDAGVPLEEVRVEVFDGLSRRRLTHVQTLRLGR
ncbi:MAG TPA: prepilin-type N-terminal cleavage/methylation domain-containing protein [Sphingobium sp.]|uniref:prepilin-type N-terminal cleavage/methylation domain-containing protein n=1 Tax=Sphingobium sp. TaxID=1912891 RepID=UPI002ED1CEBA